MTNVNFQERLEREGLSLTERQHLLFEDYRALITEWNDRIDITAITEDKEIDEKHFIDSLLIFRGLRIPLNAKVADIGTGGGFPGVPMKIYDNSIELTLIDSLNKRITFLDEVIKELGLTKTTAIHARAEEIFNDENHREKYDYAVSRAVANFPTLLEYCLPAVKVGGYFLAMKGPDSKGEIDSARPALDALGGKIVNIDEFTFSEVNYGRTIITVRKERETPRKYPRGQGKPRKDPLILKK